MKKHLVAPSHALTWATRVTDVTRNVAHLQPSITSSLESLIHWLSSGCQIWSWGNLWQNVSRKHEWQLEWTALNEQGWNRCLQQQNATNTFIYLAGSCVYMYILYIYTHMQIKENPFEWSSNNRPNMFASTRRTKFCSPPLCWSFLKYPAMPDLLKTILKQKNSQHHQTPECGPSQGSASDWLLRLLSVSNTLLSHWPSWCGHSESPCGKMMVSVRFSCGKSLGSWCAMEGVSLKENQWEIKFHASHHWEQGCTNKLYISKEAGISWSFSNSQWWCFPYRRSCWHSAWCLLTSKCCSHLQPFSEQTWYLQVKIPSNSEFLLALGTIFPKVHIKKWATASHKQWFNGQETLASHWSHEDVALATKLQVF